MGLLSRHTKECAVNWDWVSYHSILWLWIKGSLILSIDLIPWSPNLVLLRLARICLEFWGNGSISEYMQNNWNNHSFAPLKLIWRQAGLNLITSLAVRCWSRVHLMTAHDWVKVTLQWLWKNPLHWDTPLLLAPKCTSQIAYLTIHSHLKFDPWISPFSPKVATYRYEANK